MVNPLEIETLTTDGCPDGKCDTTTPTEQFADEQDVIIQQKHWYVRHQRIINKKTRFCCTLSLLVAGIVIYAIFLIARGRAMVRSVSTEPNPPIWPASVILIHANMDTETIQDLTRHTQDTIDPNGVNPEQPNETIFTAGHHFSDKRYAILFAPGVYDGLDLEVGYYVQVVGLGATPQHVTFQNGRGPYCPALRKNEMIGGRPGLSLDTFWRVAENYATTEDQLWAVSQASPLRRVHMEQDLLLHDAGAQASGGHAVNCVVNGKVKFGSQQQWCCRSMTFNGVPVAHDYGAWSNVFVDCVGGPTESTIRQVDGRNVAVTVDNDVQVTVEKPYVTLSDNGIYSLNVPQPRVRESGQGPLGADHSGSTDEKRDFKMVRVAIASDSTASINTALLQSKDVVLSPGIYHLSESLVLAHDNQVILGLGLATLVAPTDGSPCIYVPPGLDGVRVAGILLEASKIPGSRTGTASLIEWGEEGRDVAGDPRNPGVLTDIFARVGGASLDRTVSTDVMVRIHSGNVYGDNLWLWRADHVALANGEEPNFPPLKYHRVVLGEVPCASGLEVFGDNVTIHGLAVEHTTKDQVIWRGEGGNVQFYQNELPYDADPSFGEAGYVGYRVGEQVKTHTAGGVGVYSNFRDFTVPVEAAIRHPDSEGIVFTNKFTMFLNNNGTINSIVNGEGGPAEKDHPPSLLP